MPRISPSYRALRGLLPFENSHLNFCATEPPLRRSVHFGGLRHHFGQNGDFHGSIPHPYSCCGSSSTGFRPGSLCRTRERHDQDRSPGFAEHPCFDVFPGCCLRGLNRCSRGCDGRSTGRRARMRASPDRTAASGCGERSRAAPASTAGTGDRNPSVAAWPRRDRRGGRPPAVERRQWPRRHHTGEPRLIPRFN
jgi:hypothetical protein